MKMETLNCLPMIVPISDEWYFQNSAYRLKMGVSGVEMFNLDYAQIHQGTANERLRTFLSS
jgi:hypothetical protein